MIPIADAHCDFLYAAAYHGANIASGGRASHITLDGLQKGCVRLQYFAMWTDLKHADLPWVQLEKYYRAYKTLFERHSESMQILDESVCQLTEPEQKTYAVLTLEGAEALEGQTDRLHMLRDWGVRAVAFTWNMDNKLSGAALGVSGKGLTGQGREALRTMDALGMAADVSHVSDACFYDVMEHAVITPLASHSNARALLDHARNLSDHQIRLMAERKGFIGVNFYSPFIANRRCSISQIADHICHILDAGGENIVGMGSDFDGMDQLPWSVKGPQSFPKILEALSKRGVNGELLERVAYKNLWDYTKRLITAQEN